MKHILFLLALVMSVSACSAPSSSEHEYRIGSNVYEGYFVDNGPAAPLVVIIHDWDGLTGYERRRADMLGKLGYTVFAADLYGKGVRPTEIADKRRLTSSLYGDRAEMRSRIDGSLKAAAVRGADTGNAVVIGYCFGGSCALELARSGHRLKGFVSFHGGLTTPEGQDYRNTRDPVLVFHGSADTVATLDDLAAMTKLMEKNGAPHEVITYSGAPHAFTVFDSDRYREVADRESWTRFLSFLRNRTSQE